MGVLIVFPGMNPRQETILKTVVEEYVRTAVPVGSKAVADALDLDVSPATVRNDMAALEEEGYLAQPHTSAGRVPTEQAYVHYLKHCVHAKTAPSVSTRIKHAVEDQGTPEMAMRTMARTLGELSGEMAVVAFDPDRSYYAGVSNLFDKPDFHDLAVMKSMSHLIDRFDEVIAEAFMRLPAQGPQVFIGGDNPFGKEMSSILVKVRFPSGHTGMIGLVGPKRMDYGRNLGLMERTIEILDDSNE